LLLINATCIKQIASYKSSQTSAIQFSKTQVFSKTAPLSILLVRRRFPWQRGGNLTDLRLIVKGFFHVLFKKNAFPPTTRF
jgi:hypothetical protein